MFYKMWQHKWLYCKILDEDIAGHSFSCEILYDLPRWLFKNDRVILYDKVAPQIVISLFISLLKNG